MSMKAFTEKQRQWLWFALLWLGGLLSCLGLGALVKLLFVPFKGLN